MGVCASALYTLTHADGTEEQIEVEISTDAGYSPDLASDLAKRARCSLAETFAAVWPASVEP
jgi:xanthine dehydrogenase molybdopterin-binding subunit B